MSVRNMQNGIVDTVSFIRVTQITHHNGDENNIRRQNTQKTDLSKYYNQKLWLLTKLGNIHFISSCAMLQY